MSLENAPAETTELVATFKLYTYFRPNITSSTNFINVSYDKLPHNTAMIKTII